MEEEAFEKFYARAKFGFEVLEAFDERGVSTLYRVHALLKLYDTLKKGEEMPRQKLMEAIGIKNSGQLTDSVLNSLRDNGYIEMSRGKKTLVSLTSFGEGTVDDVMEELGY